MASSIKCPHCGAENPADSQYCDQCSLRLQLGGAATAGPVSQGSALASQPVPPLTPVVSLAPPTPAGPEPAPPSPVAQEAAPTPSDSPPQPTEQVVSQLPAGERRGIPIVPALAPVSAPGALTTARRSGSPALLIGGTLLALGIFLGVGLTVFLLSGGNSPPSATPTARIAGLGATATTASAVAATGTPAQTAQVPPSVQAQITTTPNTGGNAATQKADGLLAAKQYDQALTAYQAVLDQDAQNPAALLGKGQALLALGRYPDAVNALTEALAVRGVDDETTLVARAQAYMGTRQNTEATRDAEQILKADPTSAPALLVRAWARGYSGDTAGAAADYTAAVAAQPQDPTTYRARAAFYLQQNGKKAAAITDLLKATTLAPDDATIWVELGRAYLGYEENGPNQVDAALDAFSHAIQVDPRLADAYYARAYAYLNSKGDNARALADVNGAITVGPPTSDMYRLRAQLYRDLGNDQAEVADLSQATTVNAKNAEPFTWRADYYFRHQQYDRAVADMTSAIDLEPQAIRYVTRSEYYLLTGDFAKAEADARQAIRLDPSQAESNAILAIVFFEQGQYTQALDPANAAIDHAEDYNRGEALAIRGRIYVKLNQLDNAAKDLTAAADTSGNYGLVYLGQAELEVARKNDDAALAQIQQWISSSDASSFGRGFLLQAQIEAIQGLPSQARNDLAQAQKRALFPAEHQAADALLKQLGP
jgi:Tfp pilus assembly protein PilF